MEVTADDSDNYTNILTKLFLGEMAFKGELNQVADNLYKFIFGWVDWYCTSENALFAHRKSALKSFKIDDYERFLEERKIKRDDHE